MRSNGFTLIEMLLVVVIISATMLIGWPRVDAALAQVNARDARNMVLASYQLGRSVALQSGRQVTMRVTGNQLRVEASPRLDGAGGAAAVDTIVRPQPLDTVFGVTVSTTQAAFAIDPRGLSGTSGTIRFTRAGRTDSVYISGYGRTQ